jgi:hypothetical protein
MGQLLASGAIDPADSGIGKADKSNRLKMPAACTGDLGVRCVANRYQSPASDLQVYCWF